MATDYITPTALCAERNWSKSKIKEVLGEPDRTFAIRGSRSYAYGKGSLYSMARVLEAERAHGASLLKSNKRMAASKAAADKKRQEILSWISSLQMEFCISKNITLTDLAVMAIANRNTTGECYADGSERRGFSFATYWRGCEQDPNVRRWMVNYLRHCCTDYESQLNKLYGRVGHDDAYVRLRWRINNAAEEVIAALDETKLIDRKA
jgi:hypothetical protein